METTSFQRSILTALVVFIVLFSLAFFPNILPVLAEAMTPILIGVCAAFVIDIPAVFLERKLFMKAKHGRGISVLLAIVAFILVIVLVVQLVVPQLIGCIKTFVLQAPSAVENLLNNPRIQKIISVNIGEQLENFDWDDTVQKVGQFLISGIGREGSGLTSGLSSTFSKVVTVFIGLVFAIYFLSGKRKILSAIQKLAKGHLPEERYAKIGKFMFMLCESAHNYVVGQCTEAIILGSLCALGMLLLRLPYALMVGVLVGVTALIPMVVAIIGMLVGAFMVLSVSPAKALIFILYILVLQQLENNLIYPRVVGNSVGLPGVLVLAAVTVGGTVFGLVGMLLCVPLCAALYRYMKEKLA